MANLAQIINSAETIAAEFQPSINAAFTELEAAFGFWPRVLAPNGGARTAAQCDALGTSHFISDHWEEAKDRAAVDIDDHREFRDIDEALFLSILAKHGWHNMNTAGEPFPTEPWHFAKHGVAAADSGSTPLDNSVPTQRKKTMTWNIVKQSTLTGNTPTGAVVWGKTLCATLGEPGGPIVYTRDKAADVATEFGAVYGPHRPQSDANFDLLVQLYTPKA